MDIVDRLAAAVTEHDKSAAIVSNLKKPRTDNNYGRTAQLLEDAKNTIIFLRSQLK